MYPFCVFFIWITFQRRDYEQVRSEVGRLLKSEAFNNGMRIEKLLDEDNELNEKNKANDSKSILKQFESNKISNESQKTFAKYFIFNPNEIFNLFIHLIKAASTCDYAHVNIFQIIYSLYKAFILKAKITRFSITFTITTRKV